MSLPREELEKEAKKSKRIKAAQRSKEKHLDDYAAANLEKQGHTEKIYEINKEIRSQQGEIRRLGFLCQKINKRMGTIEGRVKRCDNLIRKEEKRLEQKLEDEWVEKKRQEFRKSCYVKNLNI
jgi:hypothetical protein